MSLGKLADDKKFMFISCEEDKTKWEQLRALNKAIYSSEFILMCILKQKHLFDEFQLIN
jgi:hypothetical protein